MDCSAGAQPPAEANSHAKKATAYRVREIAWEDGRQVMAGLPEKFIYKGMPRQAALERIGKMQLKAKQSAGAPQAKGALAGTWLCYEAGADVEVFLNVAGDKSGEDVRQIYVSSPRGFRSEAGRTKITTAEFELADLSDPAGMRSAETQPAR